MSIPERNKLLQDITARTAVDLGFRRRLLSAPAEAILEAFGSRLPSDFRVRFIEKPAGVDLLVVLPDFQAFGQELDDDDLDAAAGGEGDPATW